MKTACKDCIYCKSHGWLQQCMVAPRSERYDPYTGEYDTLDPPLIDEVNKGNCKYYQKRKHFWESY